MGGVPLIAPSTHLWLVYASCVGAADVGVHSQDGHMPENYLISEHCMKIKFPSTPQKQVSNSRPVLVPLHCVIVHVREKASGQVNIIQQCIVFA